MLEWLKIKKLLLNKKHISFYNIISQLFLHIQYVTWSSLAIFASR